MRFLALCARAIAVALVVLAIARPAFADAPAPAADTALLPLAPIPPAAAVRPLDPVAATRAYLDTVPAEAHARSDAYFEGGYWLILIDFLVSSAIGIALLHTGASAKMRDIAQRATRFRFLQVALYWLQYLAITSVLGFPLALYVDYFREHAYGLSTMTMGAWLGDQAKALAIAALLGAIGIPGLYRILTVAKRTWWMWGALASLGFAVIGIALGPVYIAPVFNHYTAVTNPTVRDPILSMARANGIVATDVWEFDASRQTNRVSANVSGLFGTERISLNDNLLKRCSLPEIEAVMGHEMGHYVLNHIPKMLTGIAAILLLGFALLRVFFERLRVRFHARWKVEGVDDPAGLPLFGLIFGVYGLLLTPLANTMIRTNEAEADIFGLNASRQPDGMAQVALKLGDYRKLEPGRVEEWVFFDHPSGRSRILMAMRWKAEHAADDAHAP